MIVVFFLSLIGLILYYFERRNYYKRVLFIKEYIASINKNLNLSDKEKQEKITNFFLANGFNIVSAGKDLLFRKKDFSLGLFLFGAGFFLIGAVGYLLYYYKIQKEDEFTL